MIILLKNVQIINPLSKHHLEKKDILIENGIIVKIKNGIEAPKKSQVLDLTNCFVSVGWIDMQSTFCDPGNEHKETLESGLKCAAVGGYTGVCVLGDDSKPITNKEQVLYTKQKVADNLVDVYPLGAFFDKDHSNNLTEMFDMQQAGAAAFSDYKMQNYSSSLLLKALQYTQNINSFIITFQNNLVLSEKGQMNEGATSTALGLKGIPAIAEEIVLQHNLQLLKYTGGKMHCSTISTENSVQLIKAAKADGLNVTASVAAQYLYFDDTQLETFDSNYKVLPPFRNKKDLAALKKGLKTGVIDVVISDHTPQNIESKKVEFNFAKPGMISLQTTFNTLVSSIENIEPEFIAKCLAENPRKIIGLKQSIIEENKPACLTIFNLTDNYTLTELNNQSLSKNTPLFNVPLKGKVVAVINNNQYFINDK